MQPDIKVIEMRPGENPLPLGTARQMVEHGSKVVEYLFRHQGHIYPMWHAVAADGREFIIQPPPTADKDAVVKFVRYIFAARKIVRYLWIAEAWAVAAPAKTTDEEINEIIRAGLANHPNRVEAVMLSAEDANGVVMADRAIIRPARGKAKLGPLEIRDEGRMSGRMVGLLDYLRGTVH